MMNTLAPVQPGAITSGAPLTKGAWINSASGSFFAPGRGGWEPYLFSISSIFSLCNLEHQQGQIHVQLKAMEKIESVSPWPRHAMCQASVISLASMFWNSKPPSSPSCRALSAASDSIQCSFVYKLRANSQMKLAKPMTFRSISETTPKTLL